MTSDAHDSHLMPWHPNVPWHQLAGVDEVGRGAWFGPVVAAAVILPDRAIAPLTDLGVTDSKKLSAPKRQQLAITIQEQAIAYQIGWATVREIDRLNILHASLLAMRRAIHKLHPQPAMCWIDGNRPIPQLSIPQATLVKGDQHCLAIAAASIIAKVWRDTLMIRFDQKYPDYGLAQHKGYGSAQHRQALEQQGITPLHRRSFSPCNSQLHLF